MNLPKFKILGTNFQLKAFLYDCLEGNVPVSKANSFFRNDREHCLIPAYAYDNLQPENTKLQTMASDTYTNITFTLDLESQYDMAFALVVAIKAANNPNND